MEPREESKRSDKKSKVPQTVANGKYEIVKRLGGGCFGEVYRGINSETKEKVGVKFEDCSSSAPLQLEHEATTMNIVRNPVQPEGFAEFYFYGREDHYNVLVMELLGRSIEDRMQSCHRKFTVQSTVLVAEQALRRIEYLHSKGIIHRDIKPENFLFGVKEKAHHLYLIDFGLSKRYWDKQHSPISQKLSLTGTARYASINAHRGIEQSRRDDLEAIGHMLVYFVRGQLPWSGLEAKTKQEKYQKIKEKKEQMPLNELCEGFPDCFERYLHYCRNLGFKDRPDYDMLFKLFRSVRDQLSAKGKVVQDHDFEWNEGKDLGPLQELQPHATVMQPDDLANQKRNKAPNSSNSSPTPATADSGDKSTKRRGGFCCCGGSSPTRD